jgi:hypothetical protein
MCVNITKCSYVVMCRVISFEMGPTEQTQRGKERAGNLCVLDTCVYSILHHGLRLAFLFGFVAHTGSETHPPGPGCKAV